MHISQFPTMIFLLYFSFASVFADPANGVLELEVFPAQARLEVDEEVLVSLIARNSGEKNAINPVLEVLTPAGINILDQSSNPEFIPAGGDHAWVVTLKRIGQLSSDQKISFQVVYQADQVKKIVNQSFVVTSEPLPSAENLAEIRLETALESLLEQQEGIVYIVVTNKSEEDLQVGPIQSSGPTFVTFSHDLSNTKTLASADTMLVPVIVKVTDQVQPGQHLLVFDIPVSLASSDLERTFHLIAKHPVNVTVLGASEILDLLKIPTLLFLPGALSVFIFSLWWELNKNSYKMENPFKFPKELFWVLAITISLILLFIYPLVSQLIYGQRRNYLTTYGFKDVVLAWAVGILAGIIVIIVVVAFSYGAKFLRNLRVSYEDWKRRRKFPHPEDNAIDLLEKLDKMVLKKVVINEDVDERTYFLLKDMPDDQGNYYIGERLIIEYPTDLELNIEKLTNDQLKPDGSPHVLATQLKLENIRVSKPVIYKLKVGEFTSTKDVDVFVKVGFVGEE